MNRLRIAAAAAVLTIGGGLALVDHASAHHTTVSCQSPGVWLIVNSEADKAMTFTTNQGHSGSIPAGGSTTVVYSGTSLTVFGYWAATDSHNTNTGTGDCTVDDTTTTTTEATTSTSTVNPTSTTSSSVPSTTSSTTTVPASTSTVPTSSTSTVPTSSTSSSSTVPATTTTVPNSTTTTVPPEEPECEDDPATPINDCQTLPATR